MIDSKPGIQEAHKSPSRTNTPTENSSWRILFKLLKIKSKERNLETLREGITSLTEKQVFSTDFSPDIMQERRQDTLK